MGGDGRARRAIPTHRKERDECGTRLHAPEVIRTQEVQVKVCDYSRSGAERSIGYTVRSSLMPVKNMCGAFGFKLPFCVS